MLVNKDVTNPTPHNLVKAMEWKPEIEPENELFSNLVPDEAFIAASNYTEKTDSLWREISEEISAKNIELEKCKSSLEAAGINVGQEISRDHLPDDLIEAIAKESETKHLLEGIKTKMENLQSKDQTFDQSIKQALDLVQKDEADTLKCPESSRSQLNDPGWTAITKRISEIEKAFQDSKDSFHFITIFSHQIAHIFENHSQQPTVMFISAAKVSIQNLEVLAQGMDHVKSQLPTLKTLEGEEKEAVELVTKLVSKIEEMESQRKDLGKFFLSYNCNILRSLGTKLRTNLDNDDITGHLAGEPDHTHGDIYSRELKKHDDMCAYIRQNLAAQENILSVLDDARLNFAHVYKRQREENQRYDDKINQLILASQSSNEIMTKMENGEKFLENLEKELAKISGVLEAAKSMRDNIRSKILVPARPKVPKPKPKPKGINDDLMAELKELGMDDDPEFLEFLSQGGDLGTIMPPKSIPKLPGIPQSAVRHAMNQDQQMYYPPQQPQTSQYRQQGPPHNFSQPSIPHSTAPPYSPNTGLPNGGAGPIPPSSGPGTPGGPRLSAVEQFHKNMERMKSSNKQQPQTRLQPSGGATTQNVPNHGIPFQGVPSQGPPQVPNIPTEGLHGSVPSVSTQGAIPSVQPMSSKPQITSVPPPQDDTLARERAELEKERKRLADEQQKQVAMMQSMKAMEQQRLKQEQQFQQQQKEMMEKLQMEKANNQRQQQLLEQQRIQQQQQHQFQQHQLQQQLQQQQQQLQQQQYQQKMLLEQQKKAQQAQQDAMKSQQMNHARSLAPQQRPPNSLTPSRPPVTLSPINQPLNGPNQSTQPVRPESNPRSPVPGGIRASSPAVISQYQNPNLSYPSANQMQPRPTQSSTHTLFNGIPQSNMNSTTDDWLMKYRKPAVTNTTPSTQKNLRYPSQPNSVIPSGGVFEMFRACI